MTALIDTLRAIVRAELALARGPELGIVTAVGAREDDASDNNHQVDLRLRGSGLELKRVPVAVGRAGMSCLPRVDDLVLVVFVGGELNAPVALATLYDEALQPPVGKSAEAMYVVPDAKESGVRRLHLELPSGVTLTLDDDTVSVVCGGTELAIARDGDVTVKSAAKVTLEAQGDATIKAGGKLALEAGQTVSVKGLGVTLEGSAEAKLKAPAVSLAGNVQFSPG